MLYSIAIFPSEPIQRYADQLRRRYDPNYLMIKPHVMLHHPDVWTADQAAAVKTKLHELTPIHPPLELYFNRFATSFPLSNGIYMAMRDTKPLRSLYELLSNQIPVASIKNYSPHLLVARGLSDDELHDIYARLSRETLDYSCTINRIELLSQEADGKWISEASFSLSAQ